MPSLQIRDLPDDVYVALSRRAEAERRSLAQQAVVELRRLPEIEARRQRDELVRTLVERHAANAGKTETLDAVQLVREDRER